MSRPFLQITVFLAMVALASYYWNPGSSTSTDLQTNSRQQAATHNSRGGRTQSVTYPVAGSGEVLVLVAPRCTQKCTLLPPTPHSGDPRGRRGSFADVDLVSTTR